MFNVFVERFRVVAISEPYQVLLNNWLKLDLPETQRNFLILFLSDIAKDTNGLVFVLTGGLAMSFDLSLHRVFLEIIYIGVNGSIWHDVYIFVEFLVDNDLAIVWTIGFPQFINLSISLTLLRARFNSQVIEDLHFGSPIIPEELILQVFLKVVSMISLFLMDSVVSGDMLKVVENVRVWDKDFFAKFVVSASVHICFINRGLVKHKYLMVINICFRTKTSLYFGTFKIYWKLKFTSFIFVKFYLLLRPKGVVFLGQPIKLHIWIILTTFNQCLLYTISFDVLVNDHRMFSNQITSCLISGIRESRCLKQIRLTISLSCIQLKSNL